MTALSMYHQSEQLYAPLLYFMFAKLELENNRPNEALKILVSISDTKPYGKFFLNIQSYYMLNNFLDENSGLPTTTSILRSREVSPSLFIEYM